jgi:hypothetical protein
MTRKSLVADLQHPAVRNYFFLCVCGLLVLLLGLLAHGHEGWSLFPIAVGLATLVVRWRVGPLLLLFAVVMVLEGRPFAAFLHWGVGSQELAPYAYWTGPRLLLLPEVLICAGVLIFVAARSRLQCLVDDIFPREPSIPPPFRKGQRGPAALRGQKRSAASVTPAEILLLLATMPLWVGLALVAYPLLVPKALSRGPLDHSEGVELFIEAGLRLRFVVLGTGVVVLGLWGVIQYLAWLRWTPAEARLALQDVVWSQTRGEDRRINTWRMGARWRRKGR